MSLSKWTEFSGGGLAGEIFLSQLQRGFAELTASTEGAEIIQETPIAYPPDRSY